MSNNLVLFFSASGTTRAVAKNLSEVIGADLQEIKPKVPYRPQDLNWMDKNSRSSIEMSNKASRPEVLDTEFNPQKYDKIFLGFPIWWYVAPTCVNSFLEKYDFSNKKMVLFATSGGSKFGETVKYLKTSVDPTCEIETGEFFTRNTPNEKLKEWAEKF